MNIYISFIVFFILGAFGAFIISKYGHVLKLTDMPSERSSHIRPTPKGGGIGILAAFVFCSALSDVPPFILVSVSALSLLSFYGDFVHVSRRLRLIVQLIAAGFCVHVSDPSTGLLIIICWAIFISGTANIYNFMDGINGIAGITAICASLLLYAWFGMADGYLFVFFAIGVACLGFLPFNIPGARVFMGDVGSILIGFWFGFLVFRCSGSVMDFVTMIVFMMPFYVDSIGTIILRIMRKENIATPHRLHIYQILANEGGIAHWRVSLIYGFAQLFSGALYILFYRLYGTAAALSLSIVSCIIFCFAFIRIRMSVNTDLL